MTINIRITSYNVCYTKLLRIHQQQFKTRLLGYDSAGVDQFLEMVAEELERLHKQNNELKEELVRTRSALEEMRKREAMLKETLLTTQRMTDDIKANARKEAEVTVADAELRARITSYTVCYTKLLRVSEGLHR